MFVPSSRLRQLVGTGLIAIVLAGAVVGFYAWRVARRQQFLIDLETSGAEVLSSRIVDPRRTVSNPGWLVRSAATVHRATGIGPAQQVVHAIRAEGSEFQAHHFRNLSETRELKHLYAIGSGITDDQVTGLAVLQELRTVDLSCTGITDRALDSLFQCASLRKLSVNETRITAAAIEQFRDQRPDVVVRWSEFQSDTRQQTISRLITCGGYLRYGNSSWRRGTSDTVLVRGRWTRDIDHEEQTECLRLAATLKDIPSLWLHGLSLGPAEMKLLREFTHVRSLRLDRVRSNDFSWLEALTSLDSITYASRRSAEPVLAHACGLPNLRSIVAERVNDRSGHFIGFADQLETLWLTSASVTDDVIEQWADLTNLQRLLVDSPHISDRALETIAHFSQLDRLELGDSQISDAGLVHLQGLTKLRMLNLSDTDVTPAGFVHLVPLAQLDQLRWQARPSAEHQTDLLDTIMNSFWTELATASDDELRTMFLEFVTDLPAEEVFTLVGDRVEISQPEQWIDQMFALLHPVRTFRRAVPRCELR